jgi:hypothetical protein
MNNTILGEMVNLPKSQLIKNMNQRILLIVCVGWHFCKMNLLYYLEWYLCLLTSKSDFNYEVWSWRIRYWEKRPTSKKSTCQKVNLPKNQLTKNINQTSSVILAIGWLFRQVDFNRLLALMSMLLIAIFDCSNEVRSWTIWCLEKWSTSKKSTYQKVTLLKTWIREFH